MDSEQSSRLLLLGGVGLLIIIVGGVIAFGYWQSVIKPRNRTVLEAEGIRVSYDAMRRRMGYEYAQGQNSQDFQSTQGAAESALAEYSFTALLNEITLVTRAEPDLGVTLTDEAFLQQLRGQVGVADNADDKTFADALKRKLAETDLTESEFRRMARANALQSVVFKKFSDELPATVPQVKYQVIATDVQDDANKALERVNAGETWETVAKQLSKEQDVSTTGGLHDFIPLELADRTLADFLGTANPGDISQVLTDNGATPTYFVVQLAAREDLAISDKDKPNLATKKYNEWQQSTQANMTVVRDWDAQAQADALAWVGEHVLPKVRQNAINDQLTQIAASSAAQTAQALQPAPGTPNATTTSGTPGAETPASQPTVAATTVAGASPSVPQQPVAPGNGQ